MSSAHVQTPVGTVVVREATLADLPVIARFNLAMAAESEAKQLDPATVEAGVHRALTDPACGRYFVAEIDRVVVGQTMITMEWTDWRNGWFWWIQSVYVDPAFRGRGIFTAIYRHIRMLARATMTSRGLRLYVERDNAAAIRRYKQLGMREARYLLYEDLWTGAEGD